MATEPVQEQLPHGDVANASRESPPIFAAPHGAPRDSQSLGLPWGNIVSDVFRFDEQAAYRHLTETLTLGEVPLDYARIVTALNMAERNVVDARRLHASSVIEKDRYEAHVEQKMEVLRAAAREEIEAEVEERKKKKLPARGPTIGDIRDRVVAKWPDEVTTMEATLARIKGTVAVCDEIAEAWRSRCATLRLLADRYKP